VFPVLWTIKRNVAMPGLERGGDRNNLRRSGRQVEAIRRRHASDAIAMIRDAVDDGFKDTRQLRNDPRLAPIRSDPDFQAIVADLEFPAQPIARP
jgi:hypothetical protein